MSAPSGPDGLGDVLGEGLLVKLADADVVGAGLAGIDDVRLSQPSADLHLVAPGRDGNLSQVRQLAEAIFPNAVDGLAAAEIHQAGHLGQRVVGGIDEFLEHLGRDADGLLRVHVHPQVADADTCRGHLVRACRRHPACVLLLFLLVLLRLCQRRSRKRRRRGRDALATRGQDARGTRGRDALATRGQDARGTRGRDALATLPQFAAETVAARPGVVVAVVEGQQAFALLPEHVPLEVLGDETVEMLHFVGPVHHGHQHVFHSHQPQHLVRGVADPAHGPVVEDHGHKVADDFLDGRLVGQRRLAVGVIGGVLELGQVRGEVRDRVLHGEAEGSALGVLGVLLREVHVELPHVDLPADAELRGDDLVIAEHVILGDGNLQSPLDLPAERTFAPGLGHQLAQRPAGLEHHDRPRPFQFVVGVPQFGPLGHDGQVGVLKVSPRQIPQVGPLFAGDSQVFRHDFHLPGLLD